MNRNPVIALWLLVVGALVVAWLVLGGWIRWLPEKPCPQTTCELNRGMLPLSREGWLQAFQSYRQTHDVSMCDGSALSMSAFRRYSTLRWWRRTTNLMLVVVFFGPLLLFYWQGAILRPRLPVFTAAGLIVVLHSLLGWLTGDIGGAIPVDATQLRITFHFTVALVLLAVCLWMAYGYIYGQPEPTQPRASLSLRRAGVLFMSLHILQMLTGNLTTAFRAGGEVDSFPFMQGQFVPADISGSESTVLNLVATPLALHFLHCWLGVAVLLAAWVHARRSKLELVPDGLRGSAAASLYLALAQTAMGIGVATLGVPAWFAKLHLLTAMIILATGLLSCHRALRA